MFYRPDLIVYLWLIPVTLMIVIPTVLASVRVVMSIIKESPAEKEIVLGEEAFAKA